KARPKLQTANAAVHRSDFDRVNGFDERFEGWGYEDEDLARRLRRSGTRVLDGSTMSLMLHLFHPVHESHRPSARSSENYRYFQTGRFLTRPLKGLSSRRIEEVSLELLGDVPPELRSAAPEGGGQAEVTLVFGKKSSVFSAPSGEVTLRVPESANVLT